MNLNVPVIVPSRRNSLPVPIPAVPHQNKVQTNLRLTPRARRILDILSRRWGISQADVMEVLLRSAEDLHIAPTISARDKDALHRALEDPHKFRG